MNRRHAFTLVELLVVIAIIGILVALLLPAVQSAREAARRIQCRNNIKQLSLAMHNYHGALNEFPLGAVTWQNDSTAGRGNGQWYDDHGWYTQIFPYIEQQALADRTNFKLSISDAANDPVRRVKIAGFGCPSDGMKQNEWQSNTWGRVRGNYVVNWGNTNYGQTDKNGVKFLGAPFSYRRSANFGEIRDGSSNTLMFAECITNNVAGAPWGGPISEVQISIGGQTFNSFLPPNSKACDDIVRICPQGTGELNGIPCCNLIGGPGETVLQSFAARSKHNGGVHASRCDGSVSFYSDSIDLNLWRAMSTSQGMESFSDVN